MKILRLSNNEYEENCYIVVEKDDVTIVDPGFNYEKTVSYLNENNLKITRIILTHGHIDHTGDMDKLAKLYPDAKIYISDKDINLLYDASLNVSKGMGVSKIYSKKLNIVPVLKNEETDGFKFYATPGHTKGSMVILKNGFLFTGDTLFKGTVGRTDLPTGSSTDLSESLEFIKESFPKETKILPGHYDYSTIKDELKTNEFMKKRK